MPMKINNGLDLANQRIQNVADPSGAADAATKQYVDNALAGLAWKKPVRAATTANITLSGTQTVDGVALVANDDCLVKDQSTASGNGIYTVAAGAWTRRADADTGTELVNATVYVSEGTANADKAFTQTANATITIGSTSLAFAQVGGGTTYTASNGVLLTGSNFTGVVVGSGGLTVGASGFALDTAIAARKFSANIGNGSLTSIPVAHNLGTKDVIVQLRLNSTDAAEIADWVATDTNTVTLTFAAAPASNAYRVTVIG